MSVPSRSLPAVRVVTMDRPVRRLRTWSRAMSEGGEVLRTGVGLAVGLWPLTAVVFLVFGLALSAAFAG